MSDEAWRGGPPAIGAAIVQLLSLHARMLRVEAARRLQAASKTTKQLGTSRE